MKNDLQGGSRYNYRTKRKKTNFILNGLIGVVVLLIAVVAYSIFFSGNGKTTAKQDAQTTAQTATAEKKQSVHKAKKEDASTTTADKSSVDSAKNNNTQDQANQDNSSSSSDNNSDQPQTVNSPNQSTNAQPSTSQHVTSYDSSSQDWQQMLQTMSSATGIDQGNMTVWFLGSDKSNPGGSVGTISAKDNKQKKFRVYLQWAGNGYQATKVEPVQ